MRAGGDGVRRRRLLAVFLGFCLFGVAGAAAAQPAAVGADAGDTVSASHSEAWLLPRALPERLQAHIAKTTGLGVLPGGLSAVAASAAPSYAERVVPASLGGTVPPWAGRAPPAL